MKSRIEDLVDCYHYHMSPMGGRYDLRHTEGKVFPAWDGMAMSLITSISIEESGCCKFNIGREVTVFFHEVKTETGLEFVVKTSPEVSAREKRAIDWLANMVSGSMLWFYSPRVKYKGENIGEKYGCK